MKMALMAVQIILGVLYLMGGGWKIAGQGPTLEASMPGFSLTLIRLVGIVEVLAAAGLILPGVLRRAPRVTVVAAVFLVLEAIAFGIYHLSQGRSGPAAATLVLGALAAFVAWGRGKRP